MLRASLFNLRAGVCPEPAHQHEPAACAPLIAAAAETTDRQIAALVRTGHRTHAEQVAARDAQRQRYREIAGDDDIRVSEWGNRPLLRPGPGPDGTTVLIRSERHYGPSVMVTAHTPDGVQIYEEDVLGPPQQEPELRSRGFSAYRDIPPSEGQVIAAMERARAALHRWRAAQPSIADEIRAWLERTGLTQAQAARALEPGQMRMRDTLNRWMQGTQEPRHPGVLRLAMRQIEQERSRD